MIEREDWFVCSSTDRATLLSVLVNMNFSDVCEAFYSSSDVNGGVCTENADSGQTLISRTLFAQVLLRHSQSSKTVDDHSFVTHKMEKLFSFLFDIVAYASGMELGAMSVPLNTIIIALSSLNGGNHIDEIVT